MMQEVLVLIEKVIVMVVRYVNRVTERYAVYVMTGIRSVHI